MRSFFLMLALAVIAGCQSAPPPKDNPWEVQVKMIQEQRAAMELRLQKDREMYAAMAKDCTQDYCRMQIATAALGGQIATSKAGSQPEQLPQYVEKKGFWHEAGIELIRGLPLIGQMAVSWHQSDNSVKTSKQQYDWLTAMAGQMQPDVHIEGGYIGGSVTGSGAGIGNTFTLSGNGNAIGDGNAIDNSSGKIIGDWNNNSGRAFSPGPYTGFNGGDCHGGSAGDGSTTGGAAGECDGGSTGG